MPNPMMQIMMGGGWETVGDVAGVDRVREDDIQREIMRDGLLTGQ